MAAQKNGPTAAPATKMEAVGRALRELGPDAMPLAIKDHLKKRYNIEISAAVASDYKKKLKKKAKAAAKPAVAPSASTPGPTPTSKAAAPVKESALPAKKSAPLVKKAAAPPRNVVTAKRQGPASQALHKADETRDGSVLLEDVLTAKALLDRVGADKLRRLIDGLAR